MLFEGCARPVINLSSAVFLEVNKMLQTDNYVDILLLGFVCKLSELLWNHYSICVVTLSNGLLTHSLSLLSAPLTAIHAVSVSPSNINAYHYCARDWL